MATELQPAPRHPRPDRRGPAPPHPRGRHRPPHRRDLRLRRVDHPDLRGHPRLLPHPGRDLRRRHQGDVHASPTAAATRITLRPEATAGICRALVTNGLTQSLPQKVFCAGPMFRYERPQKGRYRQFHQIDIELIGSRRTARRRRGDRLRLGHPDRRSASPATRCWRSTRSATRKAAHAYRDALVGYFTAAPGRAVAATAWHRLDRNPLRILDSKDEARPPHRRQRADDRRPTSPTPPPRSTPACSAPGDRFGVPFRENPRIVRGLDYYGHTAFEFVTSKLGAQGTVMGGGRYDGLVRGNGRPAHAGGRLGGRDRAPRHAAGRPAASRRPRSRWCRSATAAEAAALERAADAAPRRHPRRDGVSRQPAPAHGARQPHRRPRRGDPRRGRHRATGVAR